MPQWNTAPVHPSAFVSPRARAPDQRPPTQSWSVWNYSLLPDRPASPAMWSTWMSWEWWPWVFPKCLVHLYEILLYLCAGDPFVDRIWANDVAGRVQIWRVVVWNRGNLWFVVGRRELKFYWSGPKCRQRQMSCRRNSRMCHRQTPARGICKDKRKNIFMVESIKILVLHRNMPVGRRSFPRLKKKTKCKYGSFSLKDLFVQFK